MRRLNPRVRTRHASKAVMSAANAPAGPLPLRGPLPASAQSSGAVLGPAASGL